MKRAMRRRRDRPQKRSGTTKRASRAFSKAEDALHSIVRNAISVQGRKAKDSQGGVSDIKTPGPHRPCRRLLRTPGGGRFYEAQGRMTVFKTDSAGETCFSKAC